MRSAKSAHQEQVSETGRELATLRYQGHTVEVNVHVVESPGSIEEFSSRYHQVTNGSNLQFLWVVNVSEQPSDTLVHSALAY